MKIKSLLIVSSIWMLIPSASFAASAPSVPAENPCTNDIHRYCSNAGSEAGQIAECMKKHASQLSSGCKKFGEQYKKEHAANLPQGKSSQEKNG